MFNKLKDSVVVVTGASSGIGRATAMTLAKKGAHVVAAARRVEALDELARDCEGFKGDVLVVPTDVTDEDAVEHLADQALEHFGKIDAWVNNAAVTLFAQFEEAPRDAYRRVLETNLFGYIYGARAAIRAFREQGYGNLINVSSMVTRGGSPYISAYVTSKYGVNGLTKCLRQELQDTDIDVCLVMPASIDTPLFQQAANYTGRAVKPMDPVYDPRKVSDCIVDLIKSPEDETYVGNAGRALGALHKISSKTYEKTMARQVPKKHFRELPAAPNNGNLFEPQNHWARVDGGWNGKRGITKNGAAKVATAGLMLAIPAAAWVWWNNGGQSKSWVQKLMPI